MEGNGGRGGWGVAVIIGFPEGFFMINFSSLRPIIGDPANFSSRLNKCA